LGSPRYIFGPIKIVMPRVDQGFVRGIKTLRLGPMELFIERKMRRNLRI